MRDRRATQKLWRDQRRDRGKTVKCRKNCGGTKGGTEAGPRRDRKVPQKLWRDRMTPFGLLKL